jgi:hypothetical protein
MYNFLIQHKLTCLYNKIMKNKKISKVDDNGIDESSMQEIENSINSGSSSFETPKPVKKSKGKFFGFVLIIIAIAIGAAGELLLPDVQIANIAPDAPVPANQSKLVHITGPLAEGEFTDPMFKVTSKGVLLERIVEMYQWAEEGGLYSKKWADKIIDIPQEAKAKGITNPAEMPLSSDKWQTEGVKLGAFTLSPGLTKQIGEPQDITLTQADFDKLDDEGKQAFKLQNGTYFFGLTPEQPRVGDLKIHFRKLDAGTVSILAQQSGMNLVGFRTDNGMVEKLLPGAQSMETMISSANIGDNTYLKWGARGGAIIFALFGLIKMLTGPKSHKKPKIPPKKKAKPESKKEPVEKIAAAPEPEPAEEVFHEEQTFAQDDFSPVEIENNTTNNLLTEVAASAVAINTDNSSEYKPETSVPPSFNYSEPESQPAQSIPPPPPPPLNFDADSDEMPAGIEIIGPGATQEQVYHSEAAPQQIMPQFVQSSTSTPDISLDYHDSEEMPEGIEIIGPDTGMAAYEVPPPPPVQQNEEPQSEAHGLDYIPTYTPPPEEDEEFEPAQYSPYELAEQPPQFSAENHDDDESYEEEESYDELSIPIPPPPLDFNYEPTENNNEEELLDADDFDIDFESDDDETAAFEDEPASDNHFPPVPPLPFPSILKGRKMTFDENSEEIPEAPPPGQNSMHNDDDDGEHHDAFADLLKNIPDDFDPNAEMKAPENPEQPSETEEYFDPFAEEDDDNFSPFATTEQK